MSSILLIGAHQQRVATEMREQAQLDLRVVGGEQLRARCGDECSANLAAKLGADGNVLQIRIDRREAARCRGRCLESSVDARLGIGKQRQRIDVIRFELGEMAKFQDQARHFVLLRQPFQHVLRGGDRPCLCHA